MLAAAHGGTHRVGEDAADAGPSRLEVARDAGVGAARARARDEVVDVAVEVVPDLRAGRSIVRLGVGLVLELPEGDGVGNLCQELLGLRGCAEHAIGARRVDDLRTQGAHEGLLLLRELLGDDEDHVVALADGRERDAEPHVARRPLHDRGAGGEKPVLLRLLDHEDARSVLDRAGGVPELELGEEPHVLGRANVVETDERGVADELPHRVIVPSHGDCPFSAVMSIAAAARSDSP